MSILLKAVNTTDATFSVSSDATLPESEGVIKLDSEIIIYDENYLGTLYGCKRGARSTSAASHTINTPVVVVDFYEDTVTSVVQAQLDLKAPLASPTFTGIVTLPLAVGYALATGASSEIEISSTTSAELNYLAGATSSVQVQLDDKLSLSGGTLTNTVLSTDALTINNTTASQGLLVNGKIVGRRDNGTSLAVRGLQDSSEGAAVVSSYSGIFTDSGYSVTGTLKTRYLSGGNNEMDVEIQSPHQLRLTAGANDTSDGGVRINAVTDIKLLTRGANEVDAPKYLVVDRVDTTIHADPLTNNSSDVVLKANTGSIRLNYGITNGAIGFPVLSTAQKDAIASPAEGMVVYDVTLHKLCVYTAQAGGSSTGWETVTSVLE